MAQGVTRSLGLTVALGVAAAWIAGGCHGRPLTVPRNGSWTTVTDHDAHVDEDGSWPGQNRDAGKDAITSPFATDGSSEQTPQERCSRAGDRCCLGIEQEVCTGKLVCDPPTTTCVPCGGSGQPCCGPVCDTGLTCDHSTSQFVGVCTGACGHTDGACCHKGECEMGTACSTQDETGTCQSCGLIGLTCCRGDCWSGICEYTEAPRHCVACGLKGQSCCGDRLAANVCTDGTACDRPADQTLGTCSAACGGEGHACCPGGGCRNQLACTTSDESGVCRPCGGVGEPCCKDGCRAGGACARTPTGDLVCVPA
jgi:hypothetical protein